MSGGHYRFGPFYDRHYKRKGKIVGHPIDEVYTDIANGGFSSKSDTVKSDHHYPTRYDRAVVNVIQDVPWEYHVVTDDYGQGPLTDYTVSDSISRSVGDPAFISTPGGFDAAVNNALDECIVRARLGLRADDGFNVGTAVAEARQTAGMLADTGGDMAKGLIAFRRYVSSLTSGKAKALAAAGAWLQGYYGWGSLARDAFDLHSALRTDIRRPLTIRSKYKRKLKDRVEVPDWPGYFEFSGVAKVGYTAQMNDEFISSVDKWGLMNPLEIAWELVPYSFCIDWIIPIGNTLSSLSATAGLDFRSGYLSTLYEWDYYRTRTPKYWDETAVSNGLFRVKGKRFHRHPLNGFPLPRLYANENPFSTPRILNGIALITQAVLGRK